MATRANEEQETEQEVLAPQAQTIDNATVALLNKSEIDQQITTAKRYPRKTSVFEDAAMALATQDAETADECIYALPRDGKIIEGPSARFAEIIAYAWGNCRAGARVISEDEEFVTAMGSFFDMQQNIHIGYEVRRRITKKDGKRFNSDMIATTANAACSIALRNAILKGVPKAAWRKIYNAARSTIAGDVKTLDSRRSSMIKAFELMGATQERIFKMLDVKGLSDITLDHLVVLRGVYNAIREGDTTVERAFAPPDTEDRNLAAKSQSNLERVKEKYGQTVTVPTPSKDHNLEAEYLKDQDAPPPTVAEQDPAYAEKLRKEAERQKQAVAEKFGASQPPVPTSGESKSSEAASPAPSEMQEPDTLPPVNSAPAGPEGETSPSSPSAPVVEMPPNQPQAEEEEDLEQHGLPNIFDEPPAPPRGKSSRKR